MSEDCWEQIHQAHDKDQWASLLELCGVHLRERPDHLEANIPKAVALRNLYRLEEAATLLAQTFGHPSASPKCKYQCQYELGQVLEDMGRFDDARLAYETAHQLFPNSSIPLIFRGVMELRVGDFAAARDWLNRALECPESDFDEAHFNIGSTYLAEQNYDKSIEHYQKAITLDPNYDIAWEGLADAKHAHEIREQSK